MGWGCPEVSDGSDDLRDGFQENLLKELIPEKSTARLNFQQSFLQMTGKGFASPQNLGKVFEVVSRCWWGGKLTGSTLYRFEYKENEFDKKEVEVLKPDLWDVDRRVITEVKACQTGHALNLLSRQMDGYSRLAESLPDYSIRFVIFRHQVRGIHSYSGSTADLVSMAARTVQWALILPLSVVSSLYSDYRISGRIYAGNGFDACTVIRSRFLNWLFQDPEAALAANGFQEKVTVRRWWSPGDFRINGILFRQFPVAEVEVSGDVVPF